MHAAWSLVSMVVVLGALLGPAVAQMKRERVVLVASEWTCTRVEASGGKDRCVVYERKGWR